MFLNVKAMARAASAALFLALGGSAFSQINASGFLTYTSNGSNFTYDLHVTNTGTETIGTFWYAWVPGESFLATMPTSIVTPSGWTENLISHEAGTGYGIRWVANSASTYLNPGSSLSGFKFTTTDTPAMLSGNSNYDSSFPVGTTFIYQKGPFSGDSTSFVANPVPEPAPLAALALGGLLFLRRRRA